jgi:L-aspartate oxidase
MEVIRTDCLVIGGGLAGLSYAAKMAMYGHKVTIVDSSVEGASSNSMMAQGGIVYPASNDHESLIDDIFNAGAGIGHIDSIKQIVGSAKESIDEILLRLGNVEFDKNDQGEFLLTTEGGHKEKRIIYAQDATGKAIMKALYKSLKDHPNICFINNSMAIDLMTASHNSTEHVHRFMPITCMGAFIKCFADDRVFAIEAKKTMLASGGIGQVYQHTTNGADSFGHGVSMAKRIGARIMDMEYVQFHPTAMLKSGHNPLLISEAVRGEGGVLIDSRGAPVMTSDIHPLESLAPRDIVARTITLSLLDSRDKNVYIDLSSMSSDFIKGRFPNIYRRCLTRGVDITQEPIPVVPAAHYSCGGVYVDQYGQTNIARLGAVGESACSGFHGANRLASTSLLECVSMANISAKHDHEVLASTEHLDIKIKPWVDAKEEVDESLIQQDLNIIRETLWNYCGPIRNRRRLVRASRLLGEMDWQVKSFYRNCRISKSLLNLRSAIDVGQMLLHACWNNAESIGCHYREN